MILILTGIVIGLALGIGFILLCLWHNKRYPLVKDEHAGTELAKTTIYAPPSYHLRGAK